MCFRKNYYLFLSVELNQVVLSNKLMMISHIEKRQEIKIIPVSEINEDSELENMLTYEFRF